MAGELEFEKPVIELRAKIDELKKFTQNSEMDLSAEIERLETRLSKLEADIYTNLKPWDRVQIARHAMRPTTLDYIQELFDNFSSVTVTVFMAMMKRSLEELPRLKGFLSR